MRYYCRNCSCFVRSPLATCGHCGQNHTRDGRALEQPIRTRRPAARAIPIRRYYR